MDSGLVSAFGDERQYAGNTGYDDEITKVYRYDSNVSTWKGVNRGDIVVDLDLVRGTDVGLAPALHRMRVI